MNKLGVFLVFVILAMISVITGYALLHPSATVNFMAVASILCCTGILAILLSSHN